MSSPEAGDRIKVWPDPALVYEAHVDGEVDGKPARIPVKRCRVILRPGAFLPVVEGGYEVRWNADIADRWKAGEIHLHDPAPGPAPKVAAPTPTVDPAVKE